MIKKEWKLIIPASTACMFYLFSPCYAENITPTLGNNSAYTITQGSISDYSFTTYENGHITYYKINIKSDLTNGNNNLIWTKVTEAGENTVAVSVPHNGSTVTEYYKYTYTNVDDTAYVNQSKISETDSAKGGAIYNSNTIENLTADFAGNYTQTSGGFHNAEGGAVFNGYSSTGKITNLNGNFAGNHVETNGADTYAQGGALQNWGTIENITGNFIGNYASKNSTERWSVDGGAIYNRKTIGKIKGDFIGNYAKSKSVSYYPSGGAIYNMYSDSSIGEIEGDFIGNYTEGYAGASGGAIGNTSSTIEKITGNFIRNYAKGENGGQGGAIDNDGTIEKINGNFIENCTTSTNYQTFGGAIYNRDAIKSVEGNFTGNFAESEHSSAWGGAIDNDGTIKNITGNFIRNYAKGENSGQGGAIYNKETIENINGNFDKNYTESQTNEALGGAIFNRGTINNITSDFTGNYAQSKNSNAKGGAIYNDKTIEKLSGNFEGNYAKTNGGAINNTNSGTINIVTDGKDVVFKNNYVGGTFTKNEDGSFTVKNGIANDIYNEGIINLNAKSSKKIELNGSVTDTNTPKGTLNIGSTTESDGYTGDVYLKDEVTQKSLNLNSGTLHLGQAVNFNSTIDLGLNGGNLDLVNNSVKTYNVNNLNINGNVNMAADVDLQNETMDKISANNITVADNSYLNVARLNLLSDAENKETNINFTENDKLKNAVRYTGDKKLQGVAPVYKYDVEYDNNTGNFKFTRGSNEYKNINPAAFVAPVAMQAGAYTAQTTTFNKALENVDAFMAMPKKERTALKMQNKYASAKSGDYTIDPNVSQYEKGEIYVNPYTTFEKIPLKNGPKVSNISYGTLIGGDSKFLDLSNGFSAKLGGFITYNGSHQSFDGVGIYQNGGTLGLTGALYKGNFFTGLVLNAGASGATANTQYGKEDFGIFMTGVASKTGYNFEFADGKFIIQPNYLMSYSYIDAFNYTNSAGSKINPKPLHAIQIEPGLQLIGNFENGWQPYLAASMVFNVLDKTKVYADGFKLPETSIKPYVRYGVGLRKNVKDRYSAFGQAFVTNGGRNGVTLQAGLTAAVGK